MKKRILSLLLALTLLAVSIGGYATLPVMVAAAVYKGDVNYDGLINANDMRMVLSYIVAEEAPDFDAADFDSNGELNTGDVRLMLEYAVAPREQVTTLDDGVYTLELANGLSADVENFGQADDTNIGLSDAIGNEAQMFYLMNTGEGIVLWTMCTTGSVLTVAEGNNVVQSTACADLYTQKWILQSASDGLVVRGFISGKALTGAGGNVFVSEYVAGSAEQQWQLNAVSTAVKYMTADDDTACRQDASSGSEWLGTISAGDTVLVTGNEVDGWYPVIAPAQETGETMIGFASASMLTAFKPKRVFIAKEDDHSGDVDLSGLYTLIENYVENNANDDRWSIMVQPMDDSGDFVHFDNGSGRMVSASLIKLWTMGEVYRQASLGNVRLTETVLDNLHEMIIVSSNEANNTLVKNTLGGGNERTGFQKVNSFASSIGCDDTEMNRLMLVSNGTQNWTSSTDCAAFLKDCYDGTLPYSEDMLNHMKGQQVNTKITSSQGITADIDIAHKTGELSGLAEHDVAIVYDSQAGGVDFILSILTAPDNNSNDATDRLIARLSAQIYTFMHEAYI